MKGIHKTVSIYPETDDILSRELEQNGIKKIKLVHLAIVFYLKYKHLEEKLKGMI